MQNKNNKNVGAVAEKSHASKGVPSDAQLAKLFYGMGGAVLVNGPVAAQELRNKAHGNGPK